MKVWVLGTVPDHENGRILGAFSTAEAGKAAVAVPCTWSPEDEGWYGVPHTPYADQYELIPFDLPPITITEASIDAFKKRAHPAPLEPNIRPALTAFLRAGIRGGGVIGSYYVTSTDGDAQLIINQDGCADTEVRLCILNHDEGESTYVVVDLRELTDRVKTVHDELR